MPTKRVFTQDIVLISKFPISEWKEFISPSIKRKINHKVFPFKNDFPKKILQYYRKHSTASFIIVLLFILLIYCFLLHCILILIVNVYFTHNCTIYNNTSIVKTSLPINFQNSTSGITKSLSSLSLTQFYYNFVSLLYLISFSLRSHHHRRTEILS